MNAVNLSWTSALSMTLLHSLWQGLIITLLTWVAARSFSSRNANSKYVVATVALFLFFVSTVITFLLIYTPQIENNATLAFSGLFDQSKAIEQTASVNYLNLVLDFLQRHQSWIVMGWAIGVFLFSLRFVAGITYLNYLRHRAIPVDYDWNNVIECLSGKLRIRGVVKLCESISVQTPIVVGYIKPIVLMPMGLLSGLSMLQVEVILIHELAHIKRHDYLINFIQSLGETIFFFNPFVWIISAWIRNERENCCDDIVLSQGYSPQLYAKTLFELETSREETGGLALALTGNKNQLLNRIKRIMEHATKNQNGREKFIPLVLVGLGLVFASWLSINPNEETDALVQDSVKREAVADTTKKPKVITYSRTTVITYDENGKPHEEMVESYDGEEMAEPPSPSDLDFDMAEVAPVLEFDFAMEPDIDMVPMMEGMELPVPVMPTTDFTIDTLPHGFKSYDEEQMKAFQDKFQHDFKAKFGDFYVKNEMEFEKLMADAQKQTNQFDKQWADQMEMALQDSKRTQEEMAHFANEREHLAQEQLRASEHAMRISQESMHQAEEQMRLNEEQMKKMEKNMKLFESEVRVLLIKDGYIESTEKLENVCLNIDGDITFNGKPIRKEHRTKYLDLHKKYFNDRSLHHEE